MKKESIMDNSTKRYLAIKRYYEKKSINPRMSEISEIKKVRKGLERGREYF